MKRNSKLCALIALVCIVALMFTVVGCGAKTNSDGPADNAAANTDNMGDASAEKITITYQTQSANDVFTKAFAKYQETHDNVELDVQVVDGGEYNTKLMSQISTNTVPDVTWYNSANVVGNFETGAFKDLTSYIDADKFVDGTFVSSVTADGVYTVFPCEMQIQGYLINTTLFKELGLEIPETFDDLINCAKVFRDNGKVLFGNGSADAWDTWGWYHMIELYNYLEDVDAIFKDGTKKFSESECTNAWLRIAELREAGAFSDTASTVTYEIAKTTLLAGDCGIITTSTDQLTGVTGSDMDNSGDIKFWFGVKFEDTDCDQNTCVRSCGNGWACSDSIDDAKMEIIADFFNNFLYTQEGADIAVTDGMILPIVDYTPNVEVTPLVESIIELTTDNSRTGILTVNDYSLALVDGNTDVWLDQALYLGTITFGLIDGSITKEDLPDYMTEYDRLITQMLEDYQMIAS